MDGSSGLFDYGYIGLFDDGCSGLLGGTFVLSVDPQPALDSHWSRDWILYFSVTVTEPPQKKFVIFRCKLSDGQPS